MAKMEINKLNKEIVLLFISSIKKGYVNIKTRQLYKKYNHAMFLQIKLKLVINCVSKMDNLCRKLLLLSLMTKLLQLKIGIDLLLSHSNRLMLIYKKEYTYLKSRFMQIVRMRENAE